MNISNTNKNGLWYEQEVGKRIIESKYYHEGEDFNGFINRVSSIFSTKELQDKMKEYLINADLFPGGRSLYGAGSKGKFKSSMSNCYILNSASDNIESIYETKKEMARIFSYGGGCGLSISKLRPKGAPVHNSARTSTGACSFVKEFNITGEIIGANNRRK